MTPPLSSPHTPRPPLRASERLGRVVRAGAALWPVKLVLAGAAVWAGMALWNWVNTESVAERNAGDTSSPLQIEGLKSFVVRQNGQKYWEISADRVQAVEGGNAWVARNVTRGILYRDGKPWISLLAPRVRLSNLTRNLDAVGGVRASGPDNFSFVTPQARWLDAKKRVEIPGPVEARLREMEFSAPNLFYQWERGDLECAERVEVRVKGGVLRGSKLSANLKARQVKLGQGVELIFVPGVAKAPRPFDAASPATATPAQTATPQTATPQTATSPAIASPAIASPAIAPAWASYDAMDAPSNMFRPRFSPLIAVAGATAPVLLAQAPAKAAPTKSAPAKAAPAAPKLVAPLAQTAGNVVIRGGTTSYTDASGVAVLGGGVTVTETGREFSLTARDVVYVQPKSQASASGDLKVETRNSTIRGAKLFGDFNAKLLSITGNVVISAYDKNNGMSGFRSNEARKPLRIACNRLDWNYATRQATLAGNIRIVQADNSGTCDKIIYDEPRNIVRLLGNVRFGNSNRQQFVGDEVVVYVDKGMVSAPNVTIRSGLDGAPKPVGNAFKMAPPIAFPGGLSPGNIALPQAPPPIESLVPKSKPVVRSKPTLAPLPDETPDKAANAPAPAKEESKTKTAAAEKVKSAPDGDGQGDAE